MSGFDLAGAYRAPERRIDPLNPAKDYWGAMGDAVALQPIQQLIEAYQFDPQDPTYDPYYNPFSNGDLDGYEEYATDFYGASNANEVSAIKRRIDLNQERRANVERELGIGSLFLSELANPINLIPLPGLAAAGLLGRGGASAISRSALRGSAGIGGLVAGEEAVRQAVDPTATIEESIAGIGMATVLGGVLGGAAGTLGRLVGKADAQATISREFLRETAVLDDGVQAMSRGGDDVTNFVEAEPSFTGAGEWQVRPTQAETSGFAPAWGKLDKVVQAVMPTVWSKLVASGHRGVGELASKLLGDYGLMLNMNKVGLATPESISVAAGAWRGRSADLIRGLEQTFTKMLAEGGQGGARIGDMSPTIIAGNVGRALGSDSKTFKDFMDEVFRAHQGDKIVSDNPFVQEAAKQVRSFFDRAKEEGLATGLLKTRKGWRQYLEIQKQRGIEYQARINELTKKMEAGEGTANDALEMERLMRGTNTIISRLRRQTLDRLNTGNELDDLIRAMDARDQKFRADLAERRMELIKAGVKKKWSTIDAMRAVDEQIAASREQLDYLNRLEADRGLTAKQAAWRDNLQEAIDKLDEAGEEPIATRARDDMQGPALPREVVTNTSADQGLGWIADNGSTPGRKALAQRLVAALDGWDVQVRSAQTLEDLPPKWRNPRAMADIQAWQRDGKSGSEIFLNETLREQQWTEEAFLHEVLHAFVASRVLRLRSMLVPDGASGKAIRKGAASLNGLYEDVKLRLDELGIDYPGNSIDTMDEFFTWGLTSREFRQALDQIKYQTVSRTRVTDQVEVTGWRAWVNDLLTWLGMEPRYIEEATRILEETQIVTAKETFDGRVVTLFKALEDAPVRRDKNVGDDVAMSVKDEGGTTGKAERTDSNEFLSPKQKAFLQKLDDMLEGKGIFDDADFAPKGDPLYIPRLWVAEKILGREDELHGILVKWFKENPLEGSNVSDEAVSKRAWDAIDRITGQAQMEDLQLFDDGGMGASFLSSRNLDIPNHLVADFIETDLSIIARTYGNRFGLMNEMTRAFGDTTAQSAIDDVLVQTAREIDATDFDAAVGKLDEFEKQLGVARDKTTGRIYDTSDEATAKRRHASYLKGYGILVSMGTAVVSSLTEPARAMMVHGFGRSFTASMDMLQNKAEFASMSAELRTITGEGADSVLNSALTRFINDGGPTGGARGFMGKQARKMTDFAYGPYFKMNLLSPFTDIMKNYNNVMAGRFMYEDIIKAADDPKVMERLASYGITPADIAAVRMERSVGKGEDGIFRLNLDQWTDQGAARRFGGAVAGVTRRSIVTPSLADLPEVVKGFYAGREYPLLTLPFQFMSWGFGAVNKIMLSSLQGRDQNAMGGAAALVGLGYMVEQLKTDDYIFDQMSETERLVRAIDRSGLAGVFADVPTMVETATLGQVGLRPLLGLPPFIRDADYYDAAGELGGPALGQVAEMVKLMNGGAEETRDVTGALRRSIPLNNILYWKELFRDLERGGAEYIDGDSDVEYAVD